MDRDMLAMLHFKMEQQLPEMFSYGGDAFDGKHIVKAIFRDASFNQMLGFISALHLTGKISGDEAKEIHNALWTMRNIGFGMPCPS